MTLDQLGSIYITPGAAELLKASGERPLTLLRRYVRGDWGKLDAEDAKMNDHAVANGKDRILASYPIGEDRIWIITEADRSVTTLLLPSEY